MSLVVDTHTAIWYLFEPDKLSIAALGAINQVILAGDSIYLPSISVVEIIYLVEKGRLRKEVLEKILSVSTKIGSGFSLVPLTLEVAEAVRQISREVIPDMPDRIIAATAAYLGLPLVTRDSKILASKVKTIW